MPKVAEWWQYKRERYVAEVGDVIVIVADASGHHVPVGTVLTVKEVTSGDDVVFNNMWILPDDYAILYLT